MPRHLLLRLEAPLIAFGGETIDNYGVIRDFPALSMITGLFANALGWRREDCELHDRLQNRLIVGARLNTPIQRLTDFQTAQLGKDDKGWTSWGFPKKGEAGLIRTNPRICATATITPVLTSSSLCAWNLRIMLSRWMILPLR